MNFSSYQKDKQKLCENIAALKDIAQSLNFSEYVQKLDNSLEQLNSDNFNVVVVGMFSRGKSTFVDALLGRRILPTSKKPTTAIITKVFYRETPRFLLHFKDENLRPKEITEEEFFELTAPKNVNENDTEELKAVLKQQDELDKISFAEVGYPLEICKNGVVLVDTPGMNDVNKTRVEITYRYLQQADAVIMVLAANQILSVSEIEFLKERILSNQIQNVFFVVNRKDTLNGLEEEKKVLDFAKDNLKKILPQDISKNLNIFLVSSYLALLYRRNINGDELNLKQIAKLPKNFSDTGFQEFENALENFLIQDKIKSKIQMHTVQAKEYANAIIEKIDKTVDISKHSLDEILKSVQKLEPEFEKARKKSAKVISDLKRNLELYAKYISDQCISAGDDMLFVACSTVENYQGDLESNRLKQEINENIGQQQRKFIDTMMRYQNTIFQGEISKVQQMLQSIFENIDTEYQVSLNLSVMPNNSAINIWTPNQNNVSKDRGDLGGYAAGVAFGGLLAGAVLPALALGTIAAWCFGFFDDTEKKAKNNIKKQLFNQFPQLVEQMQKNVLALYFTNVEKLVSDVSQTVNFKISDMENQLQKTLYAKEQKDIEQKHYLNMLDAFREKALNVQSNLL